MMKTAVGGASDTSDTDTDTDGVKVVDADKDVPETVVEPAVASGESIEVMSESAAPADDHEKIVQREMDNAEAPIEEDPVEQAAGSIIASLGSTESVETSAGKPLAGSHTETEATPSAPGSVTSMDSMNNVVTTTTTVTAIASTVHQLIPAPSAAASAASAAAPSATAAAAIGGKVAPPAFSRLPPDGHEFPPNFTEPSATAIATPTSAAANGPPPTVAAMAIMNGGGPVSAPALAKSNDKHSSFNDDLPELPKSHPPPVPRKVLRSDLNPKSTPATTNNSGPELDTTFRKPPPFPTRSSSIAESMLSRKELPSSYQSLQSVFEQRRRSVDVPDHHHHQQHHHLHQQQSTGKPPAAPTASGRITLVGSNWRKDEKSEKSVRDKIAMFSSAAADGEGPAVPAPAPGLIGGVRKYSKDFTKSSENLLGGVTSKKPTVEAIETYATLRKKAHSVEHLDEVDKSAPSHGGGESTTHGGSAYKAKFSLETSKPVVLGKAYSVENLNPVQRGEVVGKTNGGGLVDHTKILSRTTSFSGYSNGNSLATIASPSSASGVTNNNINNGNDERWKSSISNLLEQRKKSMSKLRGLVIPEKVPEAEVLADSRIIGLPIIKSKDSEIILSSGGIVKGTAGPSDGGALGALSYSRKTSTLPTPAKSSVHSLASPSLKSPSITQEVTYKTVSRMQTSVAAPSSDGKASESESELTFRKPLPPLPPAKPPRTSLVYPPKSGSSDCLRSTEDESDDSDSVLSSRVSSPPVSPVAPAPVEKYALTRTLSSETNTSITSSNSTLTSSSGSQASCSSVGSTPTVDISRKLSKSSSSEASMNRKNVLASAKCRSGRGDLKIEDVGYGVGGGAGKGGRYEDGDSTDGYEEEERRKSKSKPRNSLTNAASQGHEEKKEPTHYKVVDTVDSIVDKVIKVASYVEVVSDREEGSIAEDTTPSPMLVTVATAAAPKPQVVAEKPIVPQKEHVPKVRSTAGQPVKGREDAAPMSDLAKWVRHEAARSISHKESTGSEVMTAARMEKKTPTPPSMTRTISEPAPPRTPAPVPVKRELRSSVESKKLNLAEIRKSFESKSANSTVIPTPVKQMSRESPLAAPPTSTPIAPPPTAATHAHATPKSHAVTTTTNSHDRFSSWDSLASSSSGVSSLQTNSLGLGQASGGNPNCSGSSQTLQSTPSDYGSFSSLGSSHSLITPQDLQLIIEEADPPLATPEAFVVVLQRETPESSIGITLAGGSDYEAKEITIHKILTNSPADRDGRLRKGDRILSINGLSMRGLTHRESLSVLKTPRPEVVMVITRSKSLVLDTLTKLKRPSMGSLSSLAEKSELAGEYERKLKVQHKASRSLDLDHLDVASNEAESVFDGTASEDGLLSADDVSKCSSSNPNDNAPSYPVEVPEGCRMVEINKDGAGLGFSIEGGFDSPTGNKPLIIKKIFMGGAAEKSGLLRAGEEIVAINDASIAKMTRIQVWNMMKKLPNGNVRITLK
ncbi:treacle protein [Anopheles coustani]|uniref:treacle protein n=1 Tax=Anopheles coustani TaxID=139045 RepID=UPI002659B350|nr:treacle protein [Anopheles coustani]